MSEEEKPGALPGFTTLSCSATASGFSVGLTSPSPEEVDFLNKAFDFLFEGLRKAKSQFENGSDSGRDGVIEAVEIIRVLKNPPNPPI